MRISSQVALSSGLLTAILIAVLAYNTHQVRKLAELQRSLAEIELEAITATLGQQRLMPQFESLTLKFLVTGDRQYAERVDELRAAFEEHLRELERLELTERARAETESLRRLWDELDWARMLGEPGAREILDGRLEPEETALLNVSVRTGMEGIRGQLERVADAIGQAVEERARATFEASSRARTLSWIVVAASLAFTLPILYLTLWSIREPLRRLEAGTRSVARGIYSTPPLDTSRSDEFADIASSFNEMVTRLGELDQMKRDFLSHVSHELRTPLVTMDETNRLLLEELPGPLNEKQRKFLELNLEGSRRLAGMISKLLDLARMEERAVPFELQSDDLVRLATRVADGFEARARELGTTVGVEAPEAPVPIECDGDRIQQLIGNLVDNALKHSPPGSPVEIRVLPADRPAAAPGRSGPAGHRLDGGTAHVQVRDRGPGIPDSEKERIFEKFHQVGTPRAGGVGLGLAICAQIVEAHHGALWVEDNPGGGSVFTVALPVAQSGGAELSRGAAKAG